MPFNIIRGDITKIHVDAVVNAANSSLLGGGGVDGAIHSAAGPRLLAECKKLKGCETGQAKITKGYKMPCKYIIHTVGPVWGGGDNGEEELLYSCYKNSLELAKSRKCKSVAFPLISSGVYGYPKKEALAVAEKAITDFLSENDMEITLVIFGRDSFKLGGTLTDELKSYIDEKYVGIVSSPSPQPKGSASLFAAPTAKRKAPPPSMSETSDCCTAYTSDTEMLYNAAASDLDKLIIEMDIPFSEKLLKLIDQSGRKDSEVYNASNISKQVFHKIRSDKKYHPKKNTVLDFSIGLRLTMTETEELLRTAGFALSRSDKTDIIVGYFIERGRYNIHEINEVLFDYDQVILGMNEK